jgi:hypothetical protein
MTEEKTEYKVAVSEKQFSTAMALIMMRQSKQQELDLVEYETVQMVAEAYSKNETINDHDLKFFIETEKKFNHKERAR